MAKLDKAVQKFVKTYTSDKGTFFKAIVPDGSGGQIRRQGFLTKQDAIEYASKEYLKVLSNKGTVIGNKTLRFDEYAIEWLQNKKASGLRESSAMRYGDEINLKLIPFFGSFKLSDIEKFHLKNFIIESQRNEMSSATVSYAVNVFKSIIKQAEQDDLIPTKGIRTVPTPKHKKKQPVFWDQPQTNYFVNATKDHPNHKLWKFALWTGMRAGEIAGLKWDCIHFNRTFGGYTGCIEVKRIFNQKTRQVEETTKNGDRRTIPIFPEIRDLLLSLQRSEYVFGGNTPLDSSHFNRQLQSELKKHPQVPRVPFHGLRHSFCSRLDATGMPRRIVSQIMGHRDLNTTNKYSHVNDQTLGHEVSRWLETQNQQKTNNLQVAFG